MFFSRLHENLKRQDWFTVGLEFLVVGVGVYLALQADNWNEWRKERVAERQLLQRLHVELESSNATTSFGIDWMTGHAQMAGVLLMSLDACEVAEADRSDVANGLYLLGTVVPPNIPNAILGEFRSAGTADLIQNREITEAINEVVTGYNYYMSFHGDIIDRITPRADYVNQFVSFRIDPEVGAKQFINWDDAAFDISAICEDSRFRTSVATVRRHVYEIIRWNRLALTRQEELTKKVSAELGRLD